jgi:pimeloyl-ACP methyl ester carboxylesterase
VDHLRVTGEAIELEKACAQVGTSRIYYQVGGTGKPVVLVHGLSGSTRWWGKNVAPLARQFRVYVVDLIGFGHNRGQHFVLSEAAELLVRWMDQIGIDRASLVGHSMGGHVAADLTDTFPDRVDRLVLVNAATLPFGRTYIQNAFDLVQALRYMPISFLPILVTDAFRAGPVTILKAAREILATDMSARLSDVRVPALVVWGENDKLISLETGEKLAQSLPNAKLVVIPGAGHNPMWDRPDLFNRAVINFLGGATDSPVHPILERNDVHYEG